MSLKERQENILFCGSLTRGKGRNTNHLTKREGQGHHSFPRPATKTSKVQPLRLRHSGAKIGAGAGEPNPCFHYDLCMNTKSVALHQCKWVKRAEGDPLCGAGILDLLKAESRVVTLTKDSQALQVSDQA